MVENTTSPLSVLWHHPGGELGGGRADCYCWGKSRLPRRSPLTCGSQGAPYPLRRRKVLAPYLAFSDTTRWVVFWGVLGRLILASQAWKSRLGNTRNRSGDHKWRPLFHKLIVWKQPNIEVTAGRGYGITGGFIYLFVYFNGWHSVCLHSEHVRVDEEGKVRQGRLHGNGLGPHSSRPTSQCGGGVGMRTEEGLWLNPRSVAHSVPFFFPFLFLPWQWTLQGLNRCYPNQMLWSWADGKRSLCVGEKNLLSH